ncbi:hypothetical protein BE20_18730 [Sorangium cellulosum]|nr:hypothetical protein BE20_18730 [Sorangium cellulosum]
MDHRAPRIEGSARVGDRGVGREAGRALERASRGDERIDDADALIEQPSPLRPVSRLAQAGQVQISPCLAESYNQLLKHLSLLVARAHAFSEHDSSRAITSASSLT